MNTFCPDLASARIQVTTVGHSVGFSVLKYSSLVHVMGRVLKQKDKNSVQQCFHRHCLNGSDYCGMSSVRVWMDVTITRTYINLNKEYITPTYMRYSTYHLFIVVFEVVLAYNIYLLCKSWQSVIKTHYENHCL